MSKIVDRDTFLYYLDNADVDWEATARECIAKGFELGDENKKLKKKLERIESVFSKKYDFRTSTNEQDLDLILKIMKGEEDE